MKMIKLEVISQFLPGLTHMIGFTESDPTNAQTLTSAQITNFNRDGFLAPLPARN